MKVNELLHVLKNVNPEARIEICFADCYDPLEITGIEVSLPAGEAFKLQHPIPSDIFIQPDGFPLVLIHVEEQEVE